MITSASRGAEPAPLQSDVTTTTTTTRASIVAAPAAAAAAAPAPAAAEAPGLLDGLAGLDGLDFFAAPAPSVVETTAASVGSEPLQNSLLEEPIGNYQDPFLGKISKIIEKVGKMASQAKGRASRGPFAGHFLHFFSFCCSFFPKIGPDSFL